MPIHPIEANFRPVDPVASYQKALTLGNLMQQRQMNDQNMQFNQVRMDQEKIQNQSMQDALNEERKFKEGVARGAKPAELMGISPKLAKVHIQGIIDQDKAQLANHKERTGMLSNLLGSVKYAPDAEKQQRYEGVRNQAIQGGLIKPEEAPEQYDPAFVDQHFFAALDADKQVTAHEKSVEFAQKVIDQAPDNAKKWTDLALGQASGAQSQAELDQVRSTLEGMGAPKGVLKAIPAMWSQTAMDQLAQRAMTPDQRSQASNQKATRTETNRHNLEMEENGAKPNNAAELSVIAADPKRTPQERASAEAALKRLTQFELGTKKGEGRGGDPRLVKAVIDNPALWGDLTPTEKGAIAADLADKGFVFGKPLSESAITKITERKNGIEELRNLRSTLKANEKYMGPIAGLQALNPWSEARVAQAEIDRVKQRIGKVLEGGVLRKEDEEKYKKILATLTDEPSTALAKIDGMIGVFERELDTYVEEQRAAGRRVVTPASGGTQLPKGGGKAIDQTTAAKFYEAAGRDPAKARQLATQNGWKVQ